MKFNVNNGAITAEEFNREEEKAIYRKKLIASIKSTLGILLVVAAISVLISSTILPVMQIYGTSMTPGIKEGDIVVAVKGSHFDTGDVISFYYNNKILVKRVIANPGDWVDITDDGVVSVNGQVLEEDYVSGQALGDCTIELPYQVPEGKIFVMGDHRSTSKDSRSSEIGCVSQEQIVGKLVGRVWPLNNIGRIK